MIGFLSDRCLNFSPQTKRDKPYKRGKQAEDCPTTNDNGLCGEFNPHLSVASLKCSSIH